MFGNAKQDRLSPTPFLLVLVAFLTAGCSAAEGGQSPTSTHAAAQLMAEGAPITVCEDSCLFEGSGANRGLACAANVRGKTRVVAPNGATLARIDWQLGNWTVRPGETFLYGGCCFHSEVPEEQLRYETTFDWDDVSCPQS